MRESRTSIYKFDKSIDSYTDMKEYLLYLFKEEGISNTLFE